jgi:hypothetical protein
MSDPSASSGHRVLERTLAWLRWRRRAGRDEEGEPTARLSAAAFRAVVDERLRSLERQLDEVKARVNGLIFLLAGTVAAQLIMRLLG